ncbi:MAG: FAD-dependent monooxygenase [Deltaproteobacteria bacterium]
MRNSPGLPMLVAGGGIGGLAAALCLAQQGFDVHVFEQVAAFSEVGAGIQLSPNCTRVLHDLGLESALLRHAFVPEGVEMRDWKSGRVLFRNPLGETALRTFGFPVYHVHRADLIAVLVEAARAEPRITLDADARVTSVAQVADSVTVQAGGVRHGGALLVGADGIHSATRAAMFGADAPTFTGCIAWRGLVPADRLPTGLVRPMATAWWGPGKHFVHYYLRRGELVNCVCIVEKDGWEIESWTERGEPGELKRDFAGWHDDLQRLLEAMDPDSCFKWALFDRPPMPRWSDRRVTLLGDACHPTLPFLAQGAAMAIEDGAVLARCLARGADVPTSLARYESLRHDRTASIQAGSRRNKTLFHLSGARARIRNLVAGPLQRRVIRGLFGYDALAAAS